jgi:hypothetical protein
MQNQSTFEENNPIYVKLRPLCNFEAGLENIKL